MYSLSLNLSGTIFSFQSDEQKPRYLDLKILAWKLKGHSWSAQKSQNGFLFISSLCLIELIATDGIGFGWVELIYQHSNIHPLPVIREGEESQEDSLKITSDENFPEAWIFILIRHELDSWSSCCYALNKFLNSQTCQKGWTTKLMHGQWKFDQKLKKMNMASSWYFHVGSWRNMFHSILICLAWDSGEIVFLQSVVKSVSHGIRWKKKFWT